MFYKGCVATQRLVLSFSETWAKILKENPFMKFSIVMEFLLNDFLPLVSSYGNLCFKGARRNLKRSTEKNQNLKKDQLKKFFFLCGRVSLSWHWWYFGPDNSFHANSIPNPSVTTKSILRNCQMLPWGKISLGGKLLLYGIFSIWVLIIFEERSLTSFQVHENVMVDNICLHYSTLVLVYRTPFWP